MMLVTLMPPVPFLGQKPTGADAVGVLVGDGGNDELVGVRGVTELIQLVGEVPATPGLR